MVPCNQGTKIGVPRVFRRIPKNSSTNICGVPRNSDSYPPNTLVIRGCEKPYSKPNKWSDCSWAQKTLKLYGINNWILFEVELIKIDSKAIKKLKAIQNLIKIWIGFILIFSNLIEKFRTKEITIVNQLLFCTSFCGCLGNLK